MVQINLARGAIEGSHPFKITSVSDAFGPSGYQYLTLSMTCVDGDYAGYEVSTRLSFSPKSRFMLLDFLDSIEAPRTGTLQSDDLVGKVAWAEIEMRPNQVSGKLQPEVAKWLEPPDNAEEIIIEDDLEELGENPTIAELEDSKDELPF